MNNTLPIGTLFPPTPLPCPEWCGLDRGHGFESEDHDGGLFRYHERKIGRIEYVDHLGHTAHEDVRLVAEEHVRDNAGPVLRAGSPYMDTPELHAITGRQARQLAAALIEAADLWDQVTS